MSVVMVDLDHFKPVNDNYGHLVGDEVLVEVSTRIADSCRPYDLVGRYGGDEFLIVVPGVNASGATSLSCRVRRNICGLPIVVGENELRISASLGVAQALVSDDSETLENLISRADSAAYRAKSLGRNRVCAYESNISVSDPEEVTPAAV
jgi:diguanylate cyclase (GGDEF)-like protein